VTHPQIFLIDSTTNPNVKTTEGKGVVRARSLVHNTSKVEGRVGAPGWGLGWVTSRSIIHTNLHKPNNKLLMHNWSTFGAWMNHGQTQTHKIHHNSDLGKPSPPPYNILCAWPRSQHPNVILSQDSQVGVPKFLKLRLTQLWGLIILCAYLWLRWSLDQSFIPRQELSNSMWHTTWMQGK
jgi:hypothetical protein